MSQTYPGFVGLALKLGGLKGLSEGSLDGAASLQHLTLDRTSVKSLPERLLANLTDLRKSALKALSACHYIPECRDKIFNVLYKVLNTVPVSQVTTKLILPFI